MHFDFIYGSRKHICMDFHLKGAYNGLYTSFSILYLLAFLYAITLRWEQWSEETTVAISEIGLRLRRDLEQ